MKDNNEDRLKPRRVVYKRVKMPMPFCPVCDLMLSGNNSIISPYRCSCGEWQSNYFEDPFMFTIKQDSDNG